MVRKEYTKQEVATLLRDYSMLIMCSTLYPKEKYIDLFRVLMSKSGRSQYSLDSYYYRMIEMYEIQLTRKYMTTLYDNFFQYLSEDKIDKLRIPNEIFVNPNDRKFFSNRKIIMFIRNALNHNDFNELCKIIEDDEKTKPVIEIRMNNTKPRPFHVKITAKELAQIAGEIRNASSVKVCSFRDDKENSSNIGIFNNIYLRKFFSRKKLTEEQIKSIESHFGAGKKTKGYEFRLAKKGLEYKDFYLNPAQKRLMEEELKYWGMRNQSGTDLQTHICLKAFPFSVTKERQLFVNLAFMNGVRSKDFNATSLFDEAVRIFFNKKVGKRSLLEEYAGKFGIDKNILYDTYDIYSILSFSSAIYYGYLFDTLITEDKLELDGKAYDRTKLRDSFVHMRWHKGINESYQLYDWGNGIDDEFNPDSPTYWTKRIRFSKMSDLAEKYYRKSLGGIIPNVDLPIETGYNDNNELISIHCMKDGKAFVYVLDANSEQYDDLYIVKDKTALIPASKDEKAEFLQELDNLPKGEKEKNKNVIERIKDKLLIDISNNQITNDNGEKKEDSPML